MIEPLTTTAPLIGATVAVVVGSLALFAMLALPALKAPAMLLALVRWLARAVPGLLRRRALGGDPTRPLHVDGLSPSLARLTLQTRTTALELRRCSAEASEWPDASDSARIGWRESLLGGDRSPLMAVRDEVFAWMRVAETLPPAEREALTELGIDVDAVRRALTDDAGHRSVREVVLALAGLLWAIDERLAGASTAGYRASCAEHGAVIPFDGTRTCTAAATDDDDDRARRVRWTGALGEHGRGISRMAGSYTRTAADREDLEQDIALALWRALPTFRGESSLKTFAYKVARYCCFRHIRQRKNIGDAADPQAVADPDACIESAVLRADQRARIEEALTALPGNLESVLSMHLTGHSYAQIAETLGISERNVSVRLSRARAQLRRQLVAA